MNQNTMRIIKKYPNRRLYDTEVSSYITLVDVRNLVVEGVPFRILDAKTEDDITRNILLQIILEQEEKGEPIFTSETLMQLIRCYGDTFQDMLANYFERSLELFSKQQVEFHNKMYNPLAFMSTIAEQNIKLWNDVQDNFLRTANPLNGQNSQKDK